MRISPKNAATLYALVKKNGLKNAQVVLTGVTPGGESNVASDEYPGWFESEDNQYASRRLYRYAPLEGTMLLKGAAFSSNCSATNVVDFLGGDQATYLAIRL